MSGPAGPTGWVEITQDMVDRFADLSGDMQWIHTDPERAASGPYGGTIAHGYLSVSLIGQFLPELIQVPEKFTVLNYGLDRVRFPEALHVGSRVRAIAQIQEIASVSGGVQASIQVTLESDRADKPVCVAVVLARYLS